MPTALQNSHSKLQPLFSSAATNNMVRSPPPSKAEILQERWRDFRAAGSLMYDVCMWQHLKWPSLSLAWLPTAWQQPPAVAEAEAAAEQRRQHSFEQHAAAAAQGGQQLLQMPVDYQYLLCGAQTSGSGSAYVELYRVELPGQIPASQQQQQQQVVMQPGSMHHIMRIPHGVLDVNRIAVMPQQPNLFATCCDQPEVHLFDLCQAVVQEWAGSPTSEDTEEGAGEDDMEEEDGQAAAAAAAASGADAASDSSEAGPAEPPSPQAVLAGRSAGGFGLQFNPVKQGILLAGDSQGGVQLWDVAAAGGGARVQPLQDAQKFAPAGINDVSWHRHGTAYALALEDGQVWVQDLRAAPSSNGNASSGSGSSRGALGLSGFTGPGVRRPSSGRVHVRRQLKQSLEQIEQTGGMLAKDCFCVAFDPLHDFRLASGGADGFVKVLDMRRINQPVEELPMHAGSVTSLVWSHSLPGLLASAGEDGAVLLWDANKMQHAAAFRQPQQQGQQPQQPQGLGLPEPQRIRNVTAPVKEYSLPGLLFMHAGHLGQVGGLALHPDRPWLVASSTAEPVEAEDGSGTPVLVQDQLVMVWEANTSHGLLC